VTRSSFSFLIPLLLIVAACGGPSRPAPLPPEEPQTVQQVESLPEPSRESALRELTRSGDPEERRRALASLALLFRAENRLDEAEEALVAAAEENPLIRAHLTLQLADVRAARGNFTGAADALRSIIASDAGVVGSIARLRLGGVLAKSGDHGAARTELRAVDAIALDELNDEEFATLVDALASGGMTAEANALRFRILTEYPRSRWTERHYGALAAAGDSPLASISFAEGTKLADRLGRVNRYDQALDLLDRLKSRFPERIGSADYRYARATSLFNSRNYTLMTEEPSVPGEPYYLPIELLRARAYWRSDRGPLFLERMDAIIKENPTSKHAGEAKIQLSKYYQTDESDLERSARLLEEGMAIVGPGTDGQHLWTLGWTWVQAGKRSDALKVFERYLQKYPDADYTANALFWSAKMYEADGNVARRDEFLRRLIGQYPYAYYSYRAREILGVPLIPPNEVQSGFTFPQAALEAPNDPRLAVALELRATGLDVDAARELKRVAASVKGDPVLSWRLADFYSDAGEPLRAIGILNRDFKDLIRHGGTGIPQRFWEVLYPRFRWDEIKAAAAATATDPWLIAAIIRQESGWDPTTVSNAGAVGLMQIMPAEAATIAEGAGIGAIERSALFDPAVNIRVGAAELRQKLDAMNGNRTLAIASYNAGETAVRRWLDRTPITELDLFVDSIPYAETRLYVMIVTRNLHEYQRVYAGS
jgi:soluble lytic murein transglycosylase